MKTGLNPAEKIIREKLATLESNFLKTFALKAEVFLCHSNYYEELLPIKFFVELLPKQ